MAITTQWTTTAACVLSGGRVIELLLSVPSWGRAQQGPPVETSSDKLLCSQGDMWQLSLHSQSHHLNPPHLPPAGVNTRTRTRTHTHTHMFYKTAPLNHSPFPFSYSSALFTSLRPLICPEGCPSSSYRPHLHYSLSLSLPLSLSGCVLCTLELLIQWNTLLCRISADLLGTLQTTSIIWVLRLMYRVTIDLLCPYMGHRSPNPPQPFFYPTGRKVLWTDFVVHTTNAAASLFTESD